MTSISYRVHLSIRRTLRSKQIAKALQTKHISRGNRIDALEIVTNAVEKGKEQFIEHSIGSSDFEAHLQMEMLDIENVQKCCLFSSNSKCSDNFFACYSCKGYIAKQECRECNGTGHICGAKMVNYFLRKNLWCRCDLRAFWDLDLPKKDKQWMFVDNDVQYFGESVIACADCRRIDGVVI